MASTISAARVALYDLLAVADGLAGVQVTFGAPDAYESQEVVALTGVTDADEEFAALGAQRRAESYVLEVAIKAHDPGAPTGHSVDARAFALYDAVRAVVSANPTFAGEATVLPAEVTGVPDTAGAQAAEGGGFVCFITTRIRCQTRIT